MNTMNAQYSSHSAFKKSFVTNPHPQPPRKFSTKTKKLQGNNSITSIIAIIDQQQIKSNQIKSN